MWGGVDGVPNPHIPSFFHSISSNLHRFFVNFIIYRKFLNPQSTPKMLKSPDFLKTNFWSYKWSRNRYTIKQMCLLDDGILLVMFFNSIPQYWLIFQFYSPLVWFKMSLGPRRFYHSFYLLYSLWWISPYEK